MMIKNKDYWKEYNRKRKEYLNKKQRQRRNSKKVVIQESSCRQPMNTTQSVVDKKENDYNLNTTKSDYNLVLNTTDYNSDYNQEKVVELNTTQSSIQLLEKIEDLAKQNQNLQWDKDNCQKRHTIPKEAEFINLMWDKHYKKFVFYSCTGSCWKGKYCNNCSSLEQQIIGRIKQKDYGSN